MQIKGNHFKIKKLFLGTIWIERSFEDAKVNSIDETANSTFNKTRNFFRFEKDWSSSHFIHLRNVIILINVMPSADGREIQLCKYAHTRVLDRIQCAPGQS